MSTTRKRMMIASVVVLGCGVIGFTLMRWPPRAELTLTLKKFETNNQGLVTAFVPVSNASPHPLYVMIDSDPESGTYVPDLASMSNRITYIEINQFSVPPLLPTAAILCDIELPEQRPCGIIAALSKHYDASWRGLIQIYFERAPINYHTLEVP